MQEQKSQQAKQLYDAGQLGPAVEALTRELKSNPSDQQRRSFLFELLCLSGEWERADKQLEVLGHLGAEAELGVQVYRNCVRAEQARRRLFTDGQPPYFLTEPPGYVDIQLDAFNRLRAGDAEGARSALDEAARQRRPLPCVLDGRPCEDFRDGDDLLAPVLELIVLDKYTWVPLEQVVRVDFEPPARLRDIIWIDVSVQTHDKELRAFMPGLYAGSSAHADDRVRLGRMTDWVERAEGIYTGVGLRLFAADGEEQTPLEIRSVEFRPVPDAVPQPPPAS